MGSNNQSEWEAKRQRDQHGAYDYRTKEAERKAAEERQRQKDKPKVICTELVKQGRLDPQLYRSCNRYAERNWTQATFKGYHWWAVPLVRAMRRNELLSQLVAFFAIRRACHIAYRLGECSTGSALGHLVAIVIDGGSAILGRCCTQKDYHALYSRS